MPFYLFILVLLNIELQELGSLTKILKGNVHKITSFIEIASRALD